MRVLGRRAWIAGGFVLTVVVFAVTGAFAQTCGDPDGSGSVSVSDGVNVLRQAAALSSTCAASVSLCDVDGNGSVTVTDGVIILRSAAGLNATLSCPGVAQAAAAVIGEVQELLEIGIGFIPGSGSGSATRSAATAGCDSGTVDSGPSVTVFDQCRFGQLLFDGSVAASESSIGFSLRLTILTTDAFLELSGNLGLVGSDRVGGTADISSSEFGAFNVVFRDVSLALSSLGTPQSGSIVLTADLPGIQSIEEAFDGDNPVGVLVTLDDQSVQQFQFDPVTGLLSGGVAPLPRIARAEIAISGQASRFAIDNLGFGGTLLRFDEPEFSPPGPINGKSVRGVMFFFTVGGQPSSDAGAGLSTGPGETPRLSPPIVEGDAAGLLTLLFDPPVNAVRLDFATNPVAGAITSAGLRVFDSAGNLLDTTSQIGEVPAGFIFPEGTLGASASASAAMVAPLNEGRTVGREPAPGCGWSCRQ
jgi:hypothetical protein